MEQKLVRACTQSVWLNYLLGFSLLNVVVSAATLFGGQTSKF